MECAAAPPKGQFVDPIFLGAMVDPVVLSSGQVLDRTSILDENGKLKYKLCPMTRKDIDSDVYPVTFMKSQLRDWTL